MGELVINAYRVFILMEIIALVVQILAVKPAHEIIALIVQLDMR